MKSIIPPAGAGSDVCEEIRSVFQESSDQAAESPLMMILGRNRSTVRVLLSFLSICVLSSSRLASLATRSGITSGKSVLSFPPRNSGPSMRGVGPLYTNLTFLPKKLLNVELMLSE